MTDRRGFLLLGAAAVDSLTHNWLNVEPSRISHVLKGGRIDARLIDCLEQRVPGLRTMDLTLGGGSVRGMVDAELRLVTNLLREGSFTEAVGGTPGRCRGRTRPDRWMGQFRCGLPRRSGAVLGRRAASRALVRQRGPGREHPQVHEPAAGRHRAAGRSGSAADGNG